MASFAFLIDSSTIKRFNGIPFLGRLKKTRGLKTFPIKGVRSGAGKEIQGYLIGLSGRENTLQDIIGAGRLAERLGVQILGLGEYAALTIEDSDTVHKSLKIPFTTGHTLAAWSIFEAIYRVAKSKNIDLKNASLAIIGADKPVGNLCVKKLAEYTDRITLAADEGGAAEALKEADIVIRAGEPPQAQIKGGAAIIRGGLIRMPSGNNLSVNNRLPKNVVPASLAEAMLLALEKKFVNYSFGNNINPDQLEEIADIAARHGFEVWIPGAPVA